MITAVYQATSVLCGGWNLHETCSYTIRERGSVLYLGMATEILNLPYFCITQIMAKEARNPKPSMQRE